MAGNQRTFRSVAGGADVDPPPVDRGPLSFEGEYYRTESATIYDKPKTPVPIYVAGAGPQVAKIRRPHDRWFHLHEWQAGDLYTKTFVPTSKRPRAVQQAEAELRPDDRDESLLRHRFAPAP